MLLVFAVCTPAPVGFVCEYMNVCLSCDTFGGAIFANACLCVMVLLTFRLCLNVF